MMHRDVCSTPYNASWNRLVSPGSIHRLPDVRRRLTVKSDESALIGVNLLLVRGCAARVGFLIQWTNDTLLWITNVSIIHFT